ncbi:MAG: hypothetical protein ACP5JJ_12750 [Anaerolineae bacterium]
MNLHTRRPWSILFILWLAVTLAACGGTPTSSPTISEPESPATTTATPAPSAEPQAPATATPTPTPTLGPLPGVSTDEPAASRCQGLVGQLEVQVLVGPAEAVGLEPAAVGSVPFAVTSAEPPYLVAGQGPISYEASLSQEWGTYAVTMDMETGVQGECRGDAGSEELALVLEMDGEQLITVDAGGQHWEYPWAGTQTRELAFPLEEGATAQGEGWAVVLHLGSR